MKPYTKRAIVFYAFVFAIFSMYAWVSEQIRRSAHQHGAFLHCQGDLCPEEW